MKDGFKQEISPHGGARMKASLVKVSPSCRATKYALGLFSSVGGQGYSRSTDFQLKRTPGKGGKFRYVWLSVRVSSLVKRPSVSG